MESYTALVSMLLLLVATLALKKYVRLYIPVLVGKPSCISI